MVNSPENMKKESRPNSKEEKTSATTKQTDNEDKIKKKAADQSSQPQIKTGVYHIPATTSIRLVRLHRYKKGMFEVFEFQEDALPGEIKERIKKQRGWRDIGTQWYELVKATKAKRYEIYRNNLSKTPKCPWKNWVRFGSKFTPQRNCSKCGSQYRHADEKRMICSNCSEQSWKELDKSINELKENIFAVKKIPKGSWSQLQEIRDKVEKAEKERTCSKTKIKKLQDKMHSIYRHLIEERRTEQQEYRSFVSELETQVNSIVEHSLNNTNSERSTIERLKRLLFRIRLLCDKKKLGVREFRRLKDKLHKASKNEEDKLEAKKKAKEEKLRLWKNNEKEISDKLSAIKIGTEHNKENWDNLLAIKKEIASKSKSDDIGEHGRRSLVNLTIHMLDQEGNLREIAKGLTQSKHTANKDSSRKKTNEIKKTINKMNIGLGYSQSLWEDLVALQRDVIRLKNDGRLTETDYIEVMNQVNDKLDILKKLRSWSS